MAFYSSRSSPMGVFGNFINRPTYKVSSASSCRRGQACQACLRHRHFHRLLHPRTRAELAWGASCRGPHAPASDSARHSCQQIPKGTSENQEKTKQNEKSTTEGKKASWPVKPWSRLRIVRGRHTVSLKGTQIVTTSLGSTLTTSFHPCSLGSGSLKNGKKEKS